MRHTIQTILLCLNFIACIAQVDPPDNIKRPANYSPLKDHHFQGDWYMVIGSDPQFPFPPKQLEDASDEKKRLHSLASMKASISTINWMQSATKDKIKGLILNGDLTNNGSKEFMEVYLTLYDDLKVNLYPGLGNHDFNKKDENAIRAIKYLNDAVTDLGIPTYTPSFKSIFNKLVQGRSREIKFNNPDTSFDIVMRDNRINGSLAYSWEIEDIHFVQLNNHPFYNHEAKNGGWEAKIISSLAWLYGDLLQARKRGKQIIVNFHQMGDSDKCHFPLPLSRDLQSGADLSKNQRELMNRLFAQMMNEFKVLTIFVGHEHDSFGITGQTVKYKGEQVLNTPVFKCGAVFNNNLLLLEFFDDEKKFIIHPLRSRIKIRPTNIANPELISEIDIDNPYLIQYR